MFIYYFIFAIFAFFALIEPKKNKYGVTIFLIFLFLLSLFAGLRSEESSTDYSEYVKIFNNISSNKLLFYDQKMMVEPTFYTIASLLRTQEISIVFLFLIYASLALFLKGKTILRDSKYIFCSLIIYYSNFFLLHEMTQIRAGVATGFFLLSIPSIESKKFKSFLLYMLFAILFHISAVLYLPLFFLKDKSLNKKNYSLLLLIAIIISVLKFTFIDYLQYIPIAAIQNRYDLYTGVMANGIISNSINLFNLFSIIDLIICLLLIKYSNILEERIPHFNIYAKTYIIGVSAFFIFSTFPPIAFRVKELMIVSQFIIIPFFISFTSKNKFFVRALIVFISFIFLYTNIHFKLVKPYV